ncbi:site-specific DNA-methyltransferase [Bacillus sp. ISL-35]|uniref:site-specific DNA-methyltransferase n=1 Tax=Bacillus sp. ISL-35 TaxID=2819122 RepID=UPI001BE4F408|nr:site-specific DNA-methyltransferase [Bacillus sp. ISL-35]MBT2677369.1 site-specific DNA-methyltransferase [Bacillus sp. ISL-35]MBT2702244.1 site-specific DNA-methyltransferase [Chryseobacterium sp. ISL-80]
MSKFEKLELTWVGKNKPQKLEPRILLEDSDNSYHSSTRISENDQFNNRLIFGDNLLALKALEDEYNEKVQCIYVDPPFNTGQAFEHYEDGLEHSLWLSLMRDRFIILRNLLNESGTLFVHIDDNELGRLLVLLDEIMGEKNRISIITFKQGSVTGHKAINPGPITISNYILVYAKNKSKWRFNDVYVPKSRDKRYAQYITNIDKPYDQWEICTLNDAIASKYGLEQKNVKKQLGNKYEEIVENFVLENSSSVIRLARPDYNNVSAAARELIDRSKEHPNKVFLLERENHPPMFLIRGERILFYKDKLKLIDGSYVTGEKITNIWDDLLSNNLHKEGGVSFPKGKKPEALIKRVLEIATNPGDIVLDSFAGSGTTGAVAHKMGRQWIMVELGDHCHTHIIPRLKSVIDGEDQSGITRIVNWKGGGGFRYYRLAPSLLEKDKYGNWIISKEYNAAMLAEAMCKHKGFKYLPSETIFWKQGYSTENDFIYTTTQLINREIADQIQEQMKEEETLIICCKAFTVNSNDYPNITFEKIPTSILKNCEFGKDDYSLEIEGLPKVEMYEQIDIFEGEVDEE